MKRILVFLFLFPFFNFPAFAQEVWYFGNGAGLDFSPSGPHPVFDGKLFTLEGCASAWDESGKLLLYSDGITVWNKAHKVIRNGTGLNGHQSSTQVSVIVPQPGTAGIYFLFTVDEKGGSKGLCYSVVDLSWGGEEVTQKNIQLLPAVSEKITVAVNESKNGFWVITHQWNSNNFYAFPITAHGVGKPVISSVGSVHSEAGAGENREAIGSLAISSDGKKLASAICYRAKNNLDLFDFDNSTGKITNAKAITLTGSPYGLCFSPDGMKLYISFLKGRSGIIQYDLRDGSVLEVVESKKDNSFGTLRLGPDKKIYVARPDDFLDVIERPEEKGAACKYAGKVVDISPATGNYGLPNVFLPLSSLTLPVAASGQPASAAKAAAPAPIISKQQATTLKTEASVSSAKDGFDCARVIEKPFTKSTQMTMTDISVCESEYFLSAKNFGGSFVWSTLETTRQIAVKVSGLYKVAITKDGCTVTDSVKIRFRRDASEFRFLPSFNPETEFLNGEFYYEIDDVQGFELKVFDKKGKSILFATTNFKRKWNGKNVKGNIVPAGEYPWAVKYKPNCPKDSKPVTREGKVTVKRNN